MSRDLDEEPRADLLRRLSIAGRDLSDSAVMFHTALGQRLGLGASEWKTLGLLERFGPLTAGEIGERSGLAPASVTGILDKLEGRGWLHREKDPDDRRRVVVTLDERATRRDVGRWFEGLTRRLDDLYERYSDEQLHLLVEAFEAVAKRQREATRELTNEP